MSFHRDAKLSLSGRFALVQAIGAGMSLHAAAAAFHVSPATAHRWWHRWLGAADDDRATLACLFDRSSRPRRCPRELAAECQLRTRLTGASVSAAPRPVGPAHRGSGPHHWRRRTGAQTGARGSRRGRRRQEQAVFRKSGLSLENR